MLLFKSRGIEREVIEKTELKKWESAPGTPVTVTDISVAADREGGATTLLYIVMLITH